MSLHRLPRPLRLAAFGLAVGVILYLCLAPTDRIPQVSLWDKAEHALAWAALTLFGLALAPRRRIAIPVFTAGLGVAVEVLQATLGFGREGDWRDLAADLVGVASAVLLARLWSRR